MAPSTSASPGLLRASLVLLAGGAAAQALPLLLGPWLTRLYSPEAFGLFHLFAALAANLAVVGCARYEFALPMACSEAEAHALRRLCLRVLLLVVLCAAPFGIGWASSIEAAWPLALPLVVGALGALSLASLWANRGRRFRALAASRLLQHGGGALAQGAAGWMGVAGVGGLIGGALAGIGAALACLRLPLDGGPAGQPTLRQVATSHRDFPLWNTPHAFAGALQDLMAISLVAAIVGVEAAGFWGLAMRYVKAPATLVGGAVSQALYPELTASQSAVTAASRHAVRRLMVLLALLALPWVAVLWWLGPWLFGWLFGPAWRPAGDLAGALALYVGLHFVASPLGVVTMAWQAQRWALGLALIGQMVFIAAMAAGLHWGGLAGAGHAVSLAMLGYFGYYFWRLATWPLDTPMKQSAL